MTTSAQDDDHGTVTTERQSNRSAAQDRRARQKQSIPEWKDGRLEHAASQPLSSASIIVWRSSPDPIILVWSGRESLKSSGGSSHLMGLISALMSLEVFLRQLCPKNQVQSTRFRWTLLKMQNQLNKRTGHNINEHICDSEMCEYFCSCDISVYLLLFFCKSDFSYLKNLNRRLHNKK